MADTAVSSFGSLTGSNAAAGDLVPVIDVSASGAAKNKTFTMTELISGIQTLGTGTTPQYANERLTHSTLSYGASVAVDFTGNRYQTVTLAGNIEFTTSNLAAGRKKVIRILGDGSERTLTFPGDWTFLGDTAPTTLAANKVGRLELEAFGNADADVVVQYSAEL